MKAYAVILRADDEPENLADRIDGLGYDVIQIDEIDESPDVKLVRNHLVWQA